MFIVYIHFQISSTGNYRIVAANEHGIIESSCDVEIRPPPPRPPLPKSPQFNGRYSEQIQMPIRTPSPKYKSLPRKLAKESSALKTLSSFRTYDRPLPPLEPFPFVPDQTV